MSSERSTTALRDRKSVVWGRSGVGVWVAFRELMRRIAAAGELVEEPLDLFIFRADEQRAVDDRLEAGAVVARRADELVAVVLRVFLHRDGERRLVRCSQVDISLEPLGDATERGPILQCLLAQP